MMSHLTSVILKATDGSGLVQQLWLNISAHYYLWPSVNYLRLINRLAAILHTRWAQTSHFQRRMRCLPSTSRHCGWRKDLAMLIDYLRQSLLLLQDL